MSITPFDSIAVTRRVYTPSASGGEYVKRNSFHADGLLESIPTTAIDVEITTTDPEGDVRVIRAAPISELPNGAGTVAWTTGVCFGDHTGVDARAARRASRSI